jgi:hypothetical protein
MDYVLNAPVSHQQLPRQKHTQTRERVKGPHPKIQASDLIPLQGGRRKTATESITRIARGRDSWRGRWVYRSQRSREQEGDQGLTWPLLIQVPCISK